jgi:hypothetical protein
MAFDASLLFLPQIISDSHEQQGIVEAIATKEVLGEEMLYLA